MCKRMTFLLVYGTLKIGKCNHHVLGHDKLYIDEAVTSSRGFYMFGGAFPYVSDFDFDNEDDRGAVVGELFEIHNAVSLANIDRLESVPSLYVKREVEVVTLSGIEYKALLFVASPGANERLKIRMPMKPAGRSRLLEWG
jgi:gamma-glutamylcyclotransferase (GGCT)/AIG2-like uncharacterized protein YtfP